MARPSDSKPICPRRTKALVVLAILGIVIGMVYFHKSISIDVVAWLENAEQYRTSMMLLYVSILYAFCLAIPGVPGTELGLLLMIIFGKPGIIAAYLCTNIGLNLAFAVGRLLPGKKFLFFLCRNSALLQDNKTSLAESLMNQSDSARRLLSFWGGRLLQYRYLVIGLLLNFPGNWVIGGGGGIGVFCGLHRSFSWPKFACIAVVTTSPIPILAYIGVLNIESWLKSILI